MFTRKISTYICTLLKQNIILIANFTEFRTGLKGYLDNVENNEEILFIKRRTGKGTVLLSLDEYNFMIETLHLLSSKKNASILLESINQMKQGKVVEKDLIE